MDLQTIHIRPQRNGAFAASPPQRGNNSGAANAGFNIFEPKFLEPLDDKTRSTGFLESKFRILVQMPSPRT